MKCRNPRCADGFIDLGNSAALCPDCGGSGDVTTVYVATEIDLAEVEMLRLALRMLARAKAFNRRLGRPASPREVTALMHKLGLTLTERHHEPQEPTTALCEQAVSAPAPEAVCGDG
jgi:hypothetical protein